MRLRRKTGGDSFDSLLDTMTNVAGILIVVVSVTRLSVSEAVKRADAGAAALPDVSAEALEAARKQSEQMKALLAGLREQWGILEPEAERNRVEKETIAKAIDELGKLLNEPEKLAGNPRTLEKQLAPLKAKAEDLARRADAAQKKRDALKARVSAAEANRPASVVVRLPRPQEPPKGMKPFTLVCRGKRIYPLYMEALEKRFADELRKVVGRPHGKITLSRTDLSRIANHFSRKAIGDRYIRLRVKNLYVDLVLVYEPRTSSQGWTLEQIRKPYSEYRRLLQRLNSRKQWIRFLVWGDSFQLYIQAREMAEKRKMGGRRARLRAGWMPFPAGQALQASVMGTGGGRKPPPPD